MEWVDKGQWSREIKKYTSKKYFSRGMFQRRLEGIGSKVHVEKLPFKERYKEKAGKEKQNTVDQYWSIRQPTNHTWLLSIY